MSCPTRRIRILRLLVLLLLLAIDHPSQLQAQSPKLDFKLIYHAAQLSSQVYDGKSAIIGKYPGKSAWVATPGHTDVQYVLIHNDTRKIQAIAVRGTVSRINWKLDKDTRGIQDRKSGILLHRGFKTAADVIYRDIKPRLKRGYATYLTGHSLGGAVAGILGIYLSDDKFKIGGIYTFGQPKFTNVAGAKAYSDLPLLRIVYQNDTVALLPDETKKTDEKYAHIGPVINLLSGPHYIYGTRRQSLRFSQGSFGKLFGQISGPDHRMKRYLTNLRAKLGGAKKVRIEDRNKYIVRHKGGAAATTGDFKRNYNFNRHK